VAWGLAKLGSLGLGLVLVGVLVPKPGFFVLGTEHYDSAFRWVIVIHT